MKTKQNPPALPWGCVSPLADSVWTVTLLGSLVLCDSGALFGMTSKRSDILVPFKLKGVLL